jgi:hypothetical protein
MSIIGRRDSAFEDDGLTEWKDGRRDRLEGFLYGFRDSLEKNEIGLRFLADIISENEDRARIGHNNIIVLGKLASYAIPIRQILDQMTNPFCQQGTFGMPRVEVHPRGSWVQNNTNACIQSQAGPDVPASDVIASLILGLLSDEELYKDPSQDSFRQSLMHLYGLTKSPISEIIGNQMESRGAILDHSEGEIRIKGTHGFTWHLGFSDPEVKSFSISSSIRDGPKRLHMEDTYNFLSDCKNPHKLVPELSLYPRGLMTEHQEETREILEAEEFFHAHADTELAQILPFLSSVSRHFSPLEATIMAHPLNCGPLSSGEVE